MTAVQDTLAEFPQRPTKDQVLESLSLALEDLSDLYERVDRGGDDLVLEAAVLDRLALTATRVNTLRHVFSTLAFLANRKTQFAKKLILPG